MPYRSANPNRLSAVRLIFSVPDLWRQFKPIPAEFYEAEDGGAATVQCPCGNATRVELGRLVACRDDDLETCPRAFFRGHGSVLVARIEEPDDVESDQAMGGRDEAGG